MSFLNKVVGRKKDKKNQVTEEAVGKLRETEDMLVKKQEFLESKIEAQMQMVKKYGKSDRRAALLALKRKKRFEQQLRQIDGTLATIEMQRGALENVRTNAEVLNTMKLASDALKKAHEQMDVDDVHDLMDDVAEQRDVAQEIADAISSPIAFGSDMISEEELERELDELTQKELDHMLLETKHLDKDLPPVPHPEPETEPSSSKMKPEEDEELKQLEQWAT